MTAGAEGSELAIRARRAAFNAALADRDLRAVRGMLARDAMLVTGTDSAVVAGRKAQLAIWKRNFEAPARTLFERLPDRVALSPVEPIAMEYGQWRGIGASPADNSAGSYTAKWRLTDGDWLIEAEIYMTEE